MGFEPTTLRDLVGCSNHGATGDSMVSKHSSYTLNFDTGPHSTMITANLKGLGHAIFGNFVEFCQL